jgi:WD40 repeat protein
MTSDSALSISSPEILWHGGGNTNGKPDPVYAVDMHSDGVMATAGVDESVPPKGTVRLWRVDVDNVIEAEREEHMQNFLCDLSDHPRGAVNVCRFSPNGLMLASASEGQIVVYVVKQAIHWRTMNEENKKTQMERIWLRPSLEEIRDLQWSPDSAHVVACSINNKSEILRVESRDALLLTGHTNYVSHLLFHLLLIFWILSPKTTHSPFNSITFLCFFVCYYHRFKEWRGIHLMP